MFCGSAFRSRTRPTAGFRAVAEVSSVSHIAVARHCGARSDGEAKDGGNLDESAAPDADAVGVPSFLVSTGANVPTLPRTCRAATSCFCLGQSRSEKQAAIEFWISLTGTTTTVRTLSQDATIRGRASYGEVWRSRADSASAGSDTTSTNSPLSMLKK